MNERMERNQGINLTIPKNERMNGWTPQNVEQPPWVERCVGLPCSIVAGRSCLLLSHVCMQEGDMQHLCWVESMLWLALLGRRLSFLFALSRPYFHPPVILSVRPSAQPAPRPSSNP